MGLWLVFLARAGTVDHASGEGVGLGRRSSSYLRQIKEGTPVTLELVGYRLAIISLCVLIQCVPEYGTREESGLGGMTRGSG